jgi:hypothetical protein
MKFKKGEMVLVKHSRKGNFKGIVIEDFDTEKDEWYNIKVAKDQEVIGINTYWQEGESIPARRGLCKVERIKELK